MRDIRLPELSDKFVDISNINENTLGIILAYKNNKPVGFIGYDYDDRIWVYFDDITVNTRSECDEFLLALLKNIMSNNRADNFKLIDFGQ